MKWWLILPVAHRRLVLGLLALGLFLDHSRCRHDSDPLAGELADVFLLMEPLGLHLPLAGLYAKSQTCMLALPSVYSTTAYSPGSSGLVGQIRYTSCPTCLRKISTRSGSSTISL